MPVDSPQDLYGLPLSSFIPERQALVKALRSQKRRDDATDVGAMRKPSVAAWAVNQLVRTHRKAIRALFEAGDDLARAQAEAASGQGNADALRGATRRQRDALEDLLSAAQGLLSDEGHPLTAATLERVTDTLRAASIDGASREQVIDGCLSQELRFAGLGIGELTAFAPEGPPAPASKAKPKVGPKSSVKKETLEGAAKPAAARARKAALAAARQTEAAARRTATRAEKELTVAQARRADAAAALSTAEELLATATKRAEETASELENAQRSLGDLEAGP